MSLSVHTMTIPGPILSRGFWLYVWEVRLPDGKNVLYVGRTGDNSTPNAAAPFSRAGQHFGTNENQNMIRRHLEKREICPEQCITFELIACGPLFKETKDWNEHVPRRDKVARLEKELADSLKAAGYDVLNEVHSRKCLDTSRWAEVREAFAAHFPGLELTAA